MSNIYHIIIDKYVVSLDNSSKINIIPKINYVINRIDISNFPIKTLGNYYMDIYLLKIIKDGKINFNDILKY